MIQSWFATDPPTFTHVSAPSFRKLASEANFDASSPRSHTVIAACTLVPWVYVPSRSQSTAPIGIPAPALPLMLTHLPLEYAATGHQLSRRPVNSAGANPVPSPDHS